MNVVLSLLLLIVGAYYLAGSSSATRREVAVMVLAMVAPGPLLYGGLLLHEANDRWHQGRDASQLWGPAVINLAIGGVLALLAGFVSGRLRWARPRYVSVEGVVTSVEPIAAGGKVHWRVGFAYFAADGNAYESVDELYVGGLQPRDRCTVVYPPEQPELGTLQRVSKAPMSDDDSRSTALTEHTSAG